MIGFMIVPGQMDHPVKDQDPQLVRKFPRETSRVAPRRLSGYRDVPYVTRLGLRTAPACLQIGYGRAGRERENISRPAFAAKSPIQPSHCGIAHQLDGYGAFRKLQFVADLFEELR